MAKSAVTSWTLKAKSDWLAAWPDKYGGRLAGQPVGHSDKPFVFRCKSTEPVIQTGPDTFRLLRPPMGRNPGVNIAAFQPGDDLHRTTVRWGNLALPQVKGKAQSIEFPPVPDLKADGAPGELGAKAGSGLPVHYEVDYGPVTVKDGKLVLSELPDGAPLPIECKVTAYQVGRRVGDAVAPAPSVSAVFRILRP